MFFVRLTPAHAENFVAPAFQQQWATTDAEVASGKVARTFFWGSQPFAHTQEVYSQSPTSTRKVQYFDKARMELTKRASGTDPNAVTNGLLTVELVSGRLQLGDSDFVQHNPAANPVAGDPNNNPDCPTYATFNEAKLAYGVAGAITATNRVGRPIDQALNKYGKLSSVVVDGGSIGYTAYISQTNHNIASVFYNFFQVAPLGADKWLAVMGYPITEAYWVKAVVGGQPQDVLVQLFERRALTYTPANSSGFQVEMGNIGQHYYAWRYGVNQSNSELPGNYRLLLPQGKSLFSSSIYQAENFKVGDAPDDIKKLWANNQGLALMGVGKADAGITGFYVANLTVVGQFKPLPTTIALNTSEDSIAGFWSADGKRLVITANYYSGYSYDHTMVQVFDFNGKQLIPQDEAYTLKLGGKNQPTVFKLSNDGSYLALSRDDQLVLLNLKDKTQTTFTVIDATSPNSNSSSHFDWLVTGQLVVMADNSTNDGTGVNFEGRVSLIEPASKKIATLLNTHSKVSRLNASVSPDGSYLAFLSGGNTPTLSFRALANPEVDVSSVKLPLTVDGYSNTVNPTFGLWAADNSYVSLNSISGGVAGSRSNDFIMVTPVGGKILSTENYTDITDQAHHFSLMGSHYLLRTYYDYHEMPITFKQEVKVQNLDGSNSVTLFSTSPQRYNLDIMQIVQVPRN